MIWRNPRSLPPAEIPLARPSASITGYPPVPEVRRKSPTRAAKPKRAAPPGYFPGASHEPGGWPSFFFAARFCARVWAAFRAVWLRVCPKSAIAIAIRFAMVVTDSALGSGRTMLNRIMLATAAKLNGDAGGTYRAIISQWLHRLGVKQGRDRWVNLAETTLLRLITEVNSGNLTMQRAAERAFGLLPFIEDITNEKLGTNNREVFAVELWGRVKGEEKRQGLICDGKEQLEDCIRQAVEKQWPHFRIINLSRIVLETQCGWIVATMGSEPAKALFSTSDLGPDDRRAALKLIVEMERRLAGGRRLELPANDDWRPWDPSAEAA
jgi:hypothetical protein